MENSWKKSGDYALVIVGIVFILLYFIARGILELPDLATWERVVVALAPVPPFTMTLVYFIKGIRSLDELERKIHLEALAVAYPLVFIMLLTLGLLEKAITLPAEDLSYRHVWAFLPVFYFLGLAIARKRYA